MCCFTLIFQNVKIKNFFMDFLDELANFKQKFFYTFDFHIFNFLHFEMSRVEQHNLSPQF